MLNSFFCIDFRAEDGREQEDDVVLVQDQIRTSCPLFQGTFNSYQLDWYAGEAYIKSHRLKDFVIGEGTCYEDSPTRFVTRCSMSQPKRKGWVSYTQYVCQFGTVDRGKKSMCSSAYIVDPSTLPRSGPGSRNRLDHDSHHKGCQAKFSAIELEPNDQIPPGTTKIIFKNRFHVNKNGEPCHGSAASGCSGLPSQMARSLSEETRYFGFLRYVFRYLLYSYLRIELHRVF